MKKMFLMAATAVIAMTSCTKSESVDQVKSPIDFRNSYTKATSQMKSTTFGVIAYAKKTDDLAVATDKANVFANTEVTVDAAGACTYNGTQYWLPGYFHTFYAYSPYQAADVTPADASTAGSPSVSFTVTATDDFMYATPKKIEATVGSTPADVALVFNHALSQVGFKIKAASADYASRITVKSITLNATNNKADISLIDGAISNPTGGDVTYPQTKDQVLTDVNADYGSKMYVLPQALTGKTLVVTYLIDAEEFTKSVDLTNTLSANKITNFVVSITLDAISFTASEEDWTSEDI